MPGGLGSLRWGANGPAADAPDLLCLERYRALCTGASGGDDWAGRPGSRNSAGGNTRNRASPAKAGYRFDSELRSARGRCKWELRTEAPICGLSQGPNRRRKKSGIARCKAEAQGREVAERASATNIQIAKPL